MGSDVVLTVSYFFVYRALKVILDQLAHLALEDDQ